MLEQEGVYEYTSLGELEIDLIQLDTDILSMEYKDFFKDYFLVSLILTIVYYLFRNILFFVL